MKCKFKSILALAIALMMCVTMLPTAALAADTDGTPWDGSIAESIPVQGNTYTISTPAEFAKFAVEVNSGNDYNGKTVKLAADINLGGREFTPIGSWDNPFAGTFDGKKSDTENYTISDAVIKGYDGENGSPSIIRAGLIGCVNGGTVQNLTLDKITVVNESKSVNNTGDIFAGSELECATGAAVATLRKGTVSNVTTTSSCKVTGYLRTGGIVGDMRDVSRNDSVITGCVNNADVVGNSLYTGGIVGAAHDCPARASYMAGKITSCTNNGTILAANNGSNVGGIVGYADRTEISNCTNTGKVEGKGNYGTGGIVGTSAYNFNKLQAALSSPAATKITGCTNTSGAVVDGGRAGGILGAFAATPGVDANKKATCTISDCINEGAVNGSNGKCGAIYGLAITYKSGDAPEYTKNLVVSATGCTIGGTVYGNSANPNEAGPITK